MAKEKRSGKKSMVRLIALILSVLLVGSAVVGALISVAYSEEIPPTGSTEITLTVEEGAQGLRAFQNTHYVNETGTRLGRVLFSLGANCFRRSSGAPFEEKDFAQAYPRGFSAGGVQIERVTVNGKEALWGAQGENEAFLAVECDMAPGEASEFAFEYQILLPTANGPFGAGEIGWRLSFFAPTPCAYDVRAEEFDCVSLRAVGESVWAKPQAYRVTVDAPRNYLIGSGGSQEQIEERDGRKVTGISLPSASSFALALGKRYSAYEEECEGVKVRCLANTASGAKRALKFAGQILSIYADKIGPFPLETLTIAQADEIRDCAAHDGLLLVNQALFARGAAASLELALARGVARQYFGLAVRINPEEDPWLSEAVCAYTGLMYLEEQYGHDRFLKALNEQILPALNVTLPGGLTPDLPRSAFSTNETYGLIVRDRGTAVLHELRQAAGAKGCWAVFSAFYRNHRGQEANIDAFKAALQAGTGRDLSQAVDYHLAHISDYVNQRVEWID